MTVLSETRKQLSLPLSIDWCTSIHIHSIVPNWWWAIYHGTNARLISNSIETINIQPLCRSNSSMELNFYSFLRENIWKKNLFAPKCCAPNLIGSTLIALELLFIVLEGLFWSFYNFYVPLLGLSNWLFDYTLTFHWSYFTHAVPLKVD